MRKSTRSDSEHCSLRITHYALLFVFFQVRDALEDVCLILRSAVAHDHGLQHPGDDQGNTEQEREDQEE
jgi:hypothetical protein